MEEDAETPLPRLSLFKDPATSIKSLRRYYKGQAPQTDTYRIQGELSGESDRSAIILGAALLDDALVFRLTSKLSFIPTDDEADHIFRFEGPLGSFSSRIEIATLFGAIDDGTYSQLNIIREMRNACAHSKRPLTFNDDIVANVVKRLFNETSVMTLEMAIEGIKSAFVVEVLGLYCGLTVGSREKGYAMVRQMSLNPIGTVPSPHTRPAPS